MSISLNTLALIVALVVCCIMPVLYSIVITVLFVSKEREIKTTSRNSKNWPSGRSNPSKPRTPRRREPSDLPCRRRRGRPLKRPNRMERRWRKVIRGPQATNQNA